MTVCLFSCDTSADPDILLGAIPFDKGLFMESPAPPKPERSREAQFRILSELVTDCCWVRWRSADGSEERGWINDTFADLTGYTPEEFQEIGRSGLVHPEDLEKIQDFIDGPVGVSEHSFRIIRKDGEVRWLHERMRVREEDGGLTVYGATHDVTEERKARQILLDKGQELERRVEERTAELRRINALLEQEVEVRRRMTLELEEAKEAAEASSLAKSRFLATMTHELRTPLHGIVGLTDLLFTTQLSNQARQWLQTLENSAKSLRNMVEEVLDFSKIEADQLVLETRNFSLHRLLSEVVEQFTEMAASRGNEIHLEIGDGVVDEIAADSIRLRQVLVNLMDNAIKFTQSGQITLQVEAASRGARTGLTEFRVIDTGVGFDNAVRSRIFDPFTQADTSTTRKFGGTGLGLSISQRLVSLMGGNLEAQSKLGCGSTFSFTLPLQPWGLSNREETHSSPESPLMDGVGYRVLVAEDNPINQMVIRDQLKFLGFEVEIVENGLQALDALRSRSFDIWLLDGQMPEMDGVEAAKTWRATEEVGEHLPIIGITATAVPEKLDSYFEAGMDKILPKPYGLSDLADMLAGALLDRATDS